MPELSPHDFVSKWKCLTVREKRWLNPQTSEVSREDSQVGKTPNKTSEVSHDPKRTLTNLYNQRPTRLELAHKKLDEAVFAAYDWLSELGNDEILERLLSLNLERGM